MTMRIIYILAGNSGEAAVWARTWQPGMNLSQVRYIAQSHSLCGLLEPEFVVLPGFWKRTDAHDIWTVLQAAWAGSKFPYQYDGTEPAWALPKPPVQTVAPPPQVVMPAPPPTPPPASPVTQAVNDNVVDIDTSLRPRDVIKKVNKRFKKIQ